MLRDNKWQREDLNPRPPDSNPKHPFNSHTNSTEILALIFFNKWKLQFCSAVGLKDGKFFHSNASRWGWSFPLFNKENSINNLSGFFNIIALEQLNRPFWKLLFYYSFFPLQCIFQQLPANPIFPVHLKQEPNFTITRDKCGLGGLICLWGGKEMLLFDPGSVFEVNFLLWKVLDA